MERMRDCPSVSALADELGVHRTILYQWQRKLEHTGEGSARVTSPVRELRKQVRDLKRVLAEKTLEVDFSKVPCKKSRLGARAAEALAGRHLRPDPGADADARQPEHRAYV